MICPYCNKGIHFNETSEIAFEIDSENNVGIGFEGGYCPSCLELIVICLTGELRKDNEARGYIYAPRNERIVYPFNKSRKVLSEEVPKEYVDDFNESTLVFLASAKASAALSRRCLQRFFHTHLGIKKNSLVKEIIEFINTQQVPSYILEAVDAIRNIGNFAAHPLKDTNTGEVIDVEPGEAEWLLEVLELLFDFYFVYPKKLELRKKELNKKLQRLGKPLME